MIYLDNAATTRVSYNVFNAMKPYFLEHYGNAGSVHSMGIDASKAIEKSRGQVSKPIGADPDNIIFTAGGSEANTLAIIGVSNYLKSIGKTHIITSNVEHKSVLEAMKYLFHNGFEITYLPVTSRGTLPMCNLLSALRQNTGLVSIMCVNNETGNRYDIHSIGAICHQKNILFHTDCVQAYSGTEIDVDDDYIDFLSVSGHKIHAPKGIGFLYARDKSILNPIILGGDQEYGLRAGTENVPGIVGIGCAAEIAFYGAGERDKKFKKLRDLLVETLISEVKGVHVNGNPFPASKTVNLRFDNIDGETLLLLLSSSGIIVSAGSACSAHSAKPSHVLKSIGLSDIEARSSIRISFSEDTTIEEIKIASRAIIDSVKMLRGG